MEAAAAAVAEEEEEEEEDPTVEEDTTRRVIFETDNWEDCITESVWFGQKIPFKKRMGGSRHNKDQKCPVAAFFETPISLSICKTKIIDISDSYMKASAQHDREWEEDKVRDKWANSIESSPNITEILPLLTQLDDGMSLPTSLCSR